MEEKQVEVEKVVEKKKGGARTLPFIFSNEICERLAVVGFAVNMMSYLTLELHLPLTKSANILTNFAGTSTLTTFAGAFIADAYAGRFWTIIWASFIYLLAMTSLTLSASLPALRPPPCKGNEVCKEATEAQLSALYVSLLLSGIAGGGLRCCVVPFGADQFDESDPNNKAKSWNFFNWYYIVMGLSILISVTVIVYIQENVGWGWGLGIPTVIWFFSIVFFIAGAKRYRILSPTGSPFTRLFQVMVAAVKKRRLPKVSDPALLYQNDELDASIIANGKLLHTKQLKEETEVHARTSRKKNMEEINVEKKKGGARTLPFIFANEVCERLAIAGFGANLMSYLTQVLHLPLTKAANILTNFGGSLTLTMFVGAFIADSFAGRFWTITVASVMYLLSMVTMTLSATLPGLNPPSCKGNEVCKVANEGQLSVFYLCLVLAAIGAGGLRPCVVAFGADQFDESNPKQKAKPWNFFNWYYIVMGLSILVAVTVFVYIQDHVGWGWGIGIPTVIWFFSIVFFVGGYRMYRMVEPSGSPFTRLLQVVVAAFKKRRLSSRVPNPILLYEDDELDASIIANGKLLHTKQLKFLDKAAMLVEEDKLPSGRLNLWRVSTVHRVEELKSILRMAPIWAAGLLFITASAQQGTFTIQQARTMNRHITPSLQIPPASMSLFNTIAMLVTVTLYDRAFIPIARRFTGVDRGISYLHRMSIGFIIATIATFISGFVEIKRKNVAAAHGLIDHPKDTIPISVFWLVPQYALYGVADGFLF
ncbi:NRT1/ PTR FAMILY 3.1 [Thalictrum thalictroides]|uniref:NRT1/ PTR FAMILY 3.1 n=1 Tax=Thalictrum thalictroides TaxID=46969 RepID=A0A7J6VGG5_THATH|nr:NRT1/ PTR FAMILY 3.1 [Thalictrum thalictroides]